MSADAEDIRVGDGKRGHLGGRRVLRREQVAKARRAARAGVSVDQLAREIKVSNRAISKAIYGVTWKRMTDPPPLTRPTPADPDQPSPTVLSWERVQRLRQEHRQGASVRSLASREGLSYNTVHDAVRGVTWAEWEQPQEESDERRPGVLLTADVVSDLRRAHAAGESLRALADESGFEYATVRAAVRGTSWRHITDPPPVPAKGRGGRHALSAEQESDLVRMREEESKTYAELGVEFGVSEATAWHVYKRRRSAAPS
ncbi:hypothetical protein [Streptomyces sp. NPDC055992]|uniref:hypothetical protein n=1 Tax=Streptomyces sp. NPDC055992 TaxID=3345673 RepID=UPI0035D52C5C